MRQNPSYCIAVAKFGQRTPGSFNQQHGYVACRDVEAEA